MLKGRRRFPFMDKTKLIVKNLPNTAQDVRSSLKSKSGAISVKSYGRCRALLRFLDEAAANFALRKLHQQELFGRTLSVEYLGTRKISLGPQNDSEKQSQSLSSFIQNLYSTNIAHGFEQPPPPYLKYNYPPINRTILDSISIALLTNSKFYHQVLHLMNRMNLEPPFLPLRKPFIPPGEPCDAQTQTEFETEDAAKNKLIASDESELESDEEKTHRKVNRKRKKLLDTIVIRNKVRKIISAQSQEKHLQPTPRKEIQRDSIFEETKNLSQKISLNISAVKLPEDNDTQDYVSPTQSSEGNPIVSSSFASDDLSLNRIPESQLKDLAVFKNYQRGEISNKLYIKNLSKDVTEKDLESVYLRFVSTEKELSIKLMLFGKMKGQAFVTFVNVGENYDIVEKALHETNGYILKSKPMVVCFGKKS